jgi:tetratricopeptide (TPR) repeat protein
MAGAGDNSHSPTDGPENLVSRLARTPRTAVAWARAKPFSRIPLALTPLLAGVVATVILVRPSESENSLPTLTDVVQAIDDEDLDAAQSLYLALEAQPSPTKPPPGMSLYLRGAKLIQRAHHATEEHDRRQIYRVAAGCLQQSLDQGLPQELWDLAVLQAAACLNQSRQFAKTIDLLQRAHEAELASTNTVDHLLAESYASLPDPDWIRAIEHLDRLLANDSLEPTDRQSAGMDRVQALLELNRDDEAKQSLDSLAQQRVSQPSRLQVLQARLLVRAAVRQKAAAGAEREIPLELLTPLDEALNQLNEVIAREPFNHPARRQADYLKGVCLRDRGDIEAALKAFTAARRLHSGDPNGLVAALAEAELLQHLHRDQEALTAFRSLLDEAPSPQEFSSPWISLTGFRARLLAAQARWLSQHKYDEAIALARALPPLISSDRAMLLQAEARVAWAQQLAVQAAADRPPSREAVTSQSRKQFRLAGVAFAHVALLRAATREYTDDIWRSAENFLRGHDFRHAARMFQFYLDQEPRSRRADAQTFLGESLLSLGELDRALTNLTDVFQSYPQHPASYRARILAATAHMEQGNLAEAKQLLQANLEHESLRPESLEWRDSLFLLGETLYREGLTFEAESREVGVDANDLDAAKAGLEKLQQCHQACREAARVFQEAIARYGDAPQALRARYYLAESRREAAKYPRKRAATIDLEATRSAIEREMQSELTAAIDAYDDLINHLSQREHLGEMKAEDVASFSNAEKAMLRNAYFGRADSLFDLEFYDEAIRAYTLAANRFQNDPVALEAFVQIASCHRRMGRPAEALGVLEQAKVVLQRIPQDAGFQRATRYGRTQWEELLGVLGAE